MIPSRRFRRASRTLVFALLCVAIWLGVRAPAASAQEGRRVSSRELAKLGFFEDFDELNLEELLSPETEVTVSIASGQDQPIEKAPGVVSVVTGDEIRSLGATTLEEVLRTVPGVDVLADNLGRGRIVMRGIPSGLSGGSSESVLLLFNGHPVNEAVNGGFTIVNLSIPVDNIKRVEILRGPASALYGGGALAGVINIITETTDDLRGISASVGFGSFGAQQYTLRLGNDVKGVSVVGFFQLSDASGAQLLIPADVLTGRDRERLASGQPAVSQAPGNATDDRQTLEARYRVDYRNFTLNWRSRRENSGGFIGFADALGTRNDLNSRQLGLDLAYTRSLRSGGTLVSKLFFTQNEIQNALQAFPPGFSLRSSAGLLVQYPSGVFLETRLNSMRYGAEAVYARQLPRENQFIGGLSLARESTFDLQADANLDFGTSTPRPAIEPLPGVVADSARTVFSLYAQDTWNGRKDLAVTGGLRLDHYSSVGTTLNPRLAVVGSLPSGLQKHLPASIAEGLSFKVLYGRAFRAPTFAEMFFSLPGFIGNPDLDPTTLNTIEAGLSYNNKDVRVSGSYFLSFVRGTIMPEEAFSPTRPQRLINGPGLDIQGFELEARRTFRAHSAFLSYTHQRPKDSESGNSAPGLSSNLAFLGGTIAATDRFGVTPTWILRSRRPREQGDPRPPLGGFGVVNVSLRARNLFKTLEISATANNLFGKRYFDPSPINGVPGDYPRPFRSLFVKATYKF